MSDVDQNKNNVMASLYRDQAILDLNAMRILYDAENYGNSAYHCQQSIEKMIKGVMYKHGLKPPKNHIVIIDLIEMIEEESKKINEKPITGYVKTSKCIIKQIQEKQTKLSWWRNSFVIENNKDHQRFCKILKKQISETPKHTKYVKECVQKSKRIPTRIKRQNLRKNVDKFEKYFKQMKKHLDEKSELSVVSLALFHCNSRWLNLLSEATLYEPNKDDKRIIDLLILLGWIVNFSVPLLKIYSHEEQGRYPEIIDNESSLEWYNEKHLELRKLEEEIENACCELNKKFFLDSDD